jgi:hypothetical protein
MFWVSIDSFRTPLAPPEWLSFAVIAGALVVLWMEYGDNHESPAEPDAKPRSPAEKKKV